MIDRINIHPVPQGQDLLLMEIWYKILKQRINNLNNQILLKYYRTLVHTHLTPIK